MKPSEETTHIDGFESHKIGQASSDTDPIAVASAPIEESARWLRTFAEPRYAVPILLIVGVALYLVNLGGYPLYTKGEPREAVTVFAIVHGGGLILPQRAGVEIPSKPLLMHWLAALVSIVAGGVNEFSVRLPSALLAIGGVIVCYWYVRRLFDDLIALIAALILATTFQYLQSATGARVDMTLTFFMEVAFFEFILMAEGLTRRRMLLYGAIALAVLTKGPVGLILPGAVALIWISIEKRWAFLRRMSLVRGAIVVLVVAGGWYVAAYVEGGPDFFRKQVLTENVLRFAGGSDFHEGHLHPFYYMEMALLAGFMPWTILLPVVAVQASRRPRRLDPRFRYLLIWFITVLIFYNFPQSKRGVYLLCMYPAFATLAAIYVCDAVARRETARTWVNWMCRLCGFAIVLIGAAALVTFAMLFLRPQTGADLLAAMSVRAAAFPVILRRTAREQWFVSVAMPLALVSVGWFLARSRPQIERMVLALAAAMVFITVAVNVVVVPAIANTLSLKNFTDDAMKIVDGNRAGYLGALNYDVAFYSRRIIPIVSIRDPNLPEYLIGWQSIFDALPKSRRDRYDVMMISNPTSLDGSDEMVLLRERATPGKPLPKPADGYIEAMTLSAIY
jgi:4-amino-4-deoxy-L-arabinose transferase-like glycosyltransferase